MAFQRVATFDDLPNDRGRRVVVDGIEIGLFLVDGVVHAMENACPHAGDPLSEGCLAGAIIECPAHGWTYDVTTGFAADHADGFPIPRFPVKIEDGEVWIDVAAPLDARPPRS